MSKHPHRLILMNKKTWKCTLEGCSFFVHLGLAHILVGKIGICWECGEQFQIDEYALKEEMPRCTDCRVLKPIQEVAQTQEEPIDPGEVMNPAKRKLYKELGLIK